jgi:hypothetical protein
MAPNIKVVSEETRTTENRFKNFNKESTIGISKLFEMVNLLHEKQQIEG